MILLDTTVLTYAVGSDHPLRAPCTAMVQAVHDATVRATTTTGVIQEFAHVRARRRPRSEAAALARHYATGLAPLARPDVDDLVDGLALFERSEELGAFDAVLAAVAVRRGWALASTDSAFVGLAGLIHLDPSSPTFMADARSSR